MLSKNLLVAQALAVAAYAAPATSTANPSCSAIQSSASMYPAYSSSLSSQCSMYFGTSTVTTTTSVQGTATTTPTTVVTTTSTCYTPTASGASKRQASTGPGASASSACSCLGVTPSATTTATFTRTTGVSTVTAAPVTSTAAATTYITPSGSYGEPDGTAFLDYAGHDFYGNDLLSGYCGPNGAVTISNGSSIPCSGFATCQNVCDAQNRGGAGARCAAVSYSEANTFCYLKTSINDCMPVLNSNVESGLIV